MTKPNERPEWFPKPHKDIQYNAASGWNQALDAVLKAADEHGIVFIKKEELGLNISKLKRWKPKTIIGKFPTQENE